MKPLAERSQYVRKFGSTDGSFENSSNTNVTDMSSEAQLDKSKEDKPSQQTFSSSFGLVFSCLGCVVGTGNIWRFPRIAAQNSHNQGSAAFLLVWVLFLVLWSAPMILIEYAVGRYAKSSPIKSFAKFLGPKAIWCGGWVTMVTYFISCYYSVVLGWCFYYVFHCAVYDLPNKEEISRSLFTWLLGSYWPVLTHFMATCFAALAVVGGVKWIEKANMVLVPLLLLIILFTFLWSLTRDYADYGIKYLFTPNWESLGKPSMWVDAISQNAFDTGAGMGLFIPYAAYMTKKHGIVRYATLIPSGNNVVSLICGITIFSTVFSTLIVDNDAISRTGIVEVIKTSGPGSTGLTFIWIPVLFSKFDVFGRILSVLFFICLSFAGISSLIANMELTSQTLVDFQVPRKFATPICALATFLFGLGSALNIGFLTNQDFVWGFALMISGVMLQFLVILWGGMKFRKNVINKYSESDWKAPKIWVWLVKFICPIEAVGILVWWSIDTITATPDTWYIPAVDSYITTILEWIGLFALLGIGNFILFQPSIRPSWMNETVEPKLKSYDNPDVLVVGGTTIASPNFNSFDNKGYSENIEVANRPGAFDNRAYIQDEDFQGQRTKL